MPQEIATVNDLIYILLCALISARVDHTHACSVCVLFSRAPICCGHFPCPRLSVAVEAPNCRAWVCYEKCKPVPYRSSQCFVVVLSEVLHSPGHTVLHTSAGVFLEERPTRRVAHQTESLCHVSSRRAVPVCPSPQTLTSQVSESFPIQ